MSTGHEFTDQVHVICQNGKRHQAVSVWSLKLCSEVQYSERNKTTLAHCSSPRFSLIEDTPKATQKRNRTAWREEFTRRMPLSRLDSSFKCYIGKLRCVLSVRFVSTPFGMEPGCNSNGYLQGARQDNIPHSLTSRRGSPKHP